MQRLLLLLLIITAFYCQGICIDSISINVQGIGNRGYTAHVTSSFTEAAVFLKNSPEEGYRRICLKDGLFLIVLTQDNFTPQIIDVGPLMGNKLFSIIVEKNHSYNQPEIKLADIDTAIKCVLYRQRAGGGNLFVLAIGDDDDAVSIAAVKSHQQGVMLAFDPIR